EPAAFGVGVLFGPQYTASRDARLLVDAEGAIAVSDAATMRGALERWVDDADAWRAVGVRARAVVHAGLGAAERSYQLVEELMA
ncbi:MAG: hypothetical protein JWN53_1239, partial [Gemmatimonadetes bacterium]|nr:hypothetical protein [Gemmatimonadota bacterium]